MSDLVWQKSSFSGSDAGQECVEVASEPSAGALFLRESDEPGVVIRTHPAALRGLLSAARADGAGHEPRERIDGRVGP